MDDLQGQIQMVYTVTNYGGDERSIASALREKGGNVEAVINMILDDVDKVRFQLTTRQGSCQRRTVC